MASLKDLKNRIKSVKSTQKITKAMKMVAAAKLRRAQEHARASRPYAERLEAVLGQLSRGASGNDNAPRLLIGSGKADTHLLIVATSDRGLSGAFNSSIVRASRRKISQLLGEGKQVKIICVGRKGYEQLQGEHKSRIVARREIGRKKASFADAESVAREVTALFEAGEFDVATILYNTFKSAISQIVTFQQLIPLPAPAETGEAPLPYEYEPEEEAILADLLPRNLGMQIYKALLENAASFYGSQMTAMDNATRNAGEMIGRLTLTYNRNRQAAITKELIEIISGAEAL